MERKILFKNNKKLSIPQNLVDEIYTAMLNGTGMFHGFKDDKGKVINIINISEIVAIL